MEIEGVCGVSQKDVFLEHSNEVSGLNINPSQKLAVRVAIASLEFLQDVAKTLKCGVADLDEGLLIEWAKRQQ